MTKLPYRLVAELEVPGKLTVIGDVHGKDATLECILRERSLEEELAARIHALVFLAHL